MGNRTPRKPRLKLYSSTWKWPTPLLPTRAQSLTVAETPQAEWASKGIKYVLKPPELTLLRAAERLREIEGPLLAATGTTDFELRPLSHEDYQRFQLEMKNEKMRGIAAKGSHYGDSFGWVNQYARVQRRTEHPWALSIDGGKKGHVIITTQEGEEPRFVFTSPKGEPEIVVPFLRALGGILVDETKAHVEVKKPEPHLEEALKKVGFTDDVSKFPWQGRLMPGDDRYESPIISVQELSRPGSQIYRKRREFTNSLGIRATVEVQRYNPHSLRHRTAAKFILANWARNLASDRQKGSYANAISAHEHFLRGMPDTSFAYLLFLRHKGRPRLTPLGFSLYDSVGNFDPEYLNSKLWATLDKNHPFRNAVAMMKRYLRRSSRLSDQQGPPASRGMDMAQRPVLAALVTIAPTNFNLGTFRTPSLVKQAGAMNVALSLEQLARERPEFGRALVAMGGSERVSLRDASSKKGLGPIAYLHNRVLALPPEEVSEHGVVGRLGRVRPAHEA